MQFSRQQSNNGQEAAFPFFKEGRVHKGQQYEADVSEILDFSRMELWRYAKTHGDLETWAAFQQGLEETVLSWFHEHPASEVVRRVQSDKHSSHEPLSACGRLLSEAGGVRDALRGVGLPAGVPERSHPGDAASFQAARDRL